eukprot:c11478_g1_i1.p1 GENE.c11478_g1_i1~~c11478_g1_i1.p1  ORF type:complete len:105 (-),score=14.81 c11478_g1_i1:125-439(-)
MTNLFQDQSTVVWNGIPYRGKIAIAQMLQALPPSKHTVISFDCQPVVIGEFLQPPLLNLTKIRTFCISSTTLSPSPPLQMELSPCRSPLLSVFLEKLNMGQIRP